MQHRIRRQAGFTLVEMAIVLVIISLIIAGVLTAQQVTQNAKITSTVQGIKSYQAAAQSYNQNYGALPGDDQGASTRFSTETPNGNGMGDIDVSENAGFWQHLRAANLIKGAAADATSPGDPFGGSFSVRNGAFGNALTGNLVCFSQIPASAATAIDQQMDDGKPSSGTMRAAAAGNAEDAATALSSPSPLPENAVYGNGETYIMCTPL